jgi:hypothetical protein
MIALTPHLLLGALPKIGNPLERALKLFRIAARLAVIRRG